MDHLTGMTVFARVAERASFTAAARDLGLSKSAVSKQVARLEERLGARLLHRTTRRLNLTEIGRAYFERARRIVADAEEADLAVTRLHAEPRGRLRVNAPMSFGVRHLAPMLPEYMARYPDVSLDLDFNDRQVDLIEEGFDLAVRIARLTDSTLIARKLSPCDRAIAASPEYWDTHGRPTHPQELTDHDCLLYTYLRTPGDWQFEGPDGPIAVRVNGPLKSNSGEALLEAAMAGLGVAMLPTFMAGEALCDGRLECVLRDFESTDVYAYAVWPQSRHLSAKVRTFVDFLAEQFGPEPYWDDFCQATHQPGH